MRNIFTAMMPHAPIIIPEVGGQRQKDCVLTYNSCRHISRVCLDLNPELLILISPHTPLSSKKSVSFRTSDSLEVNFSQFGCSDISFRVNNYVNSAPGLIGDFIEEHKLSKCGSPVLDHGAGVPLYFLNSYGWEGPTLILGPNYYSQAKTIQTGAYLKSALETINLRTAVIASADMSHALQEGAPGGYNPEAHKFDEKFTGIITNKDYTELENLSPSLASLACQDSLDTTLMALKISGFENEGGEFLSYEAPFGVGYLCAILNRKTSS